MKGAWLALLALGIACQAVAAEKDLPPSPPAVEPDWAAVRVQGEALVKRVLIDPSSAQFVWTEGFRWGYVKPIFGKKVYQWVGCGTLNARNRMGGYVGAKAFYVAVQSDGTVTGEYDPVNTASCLVASEYHIPPQPELRDTPANAGTGLSIADEIAKLAALRDKGILSQAEFEQQKARLLAQ